MSPQIDRRVARTRKSLHEALMSLILRKGYDATTVQDILQEADVGRSTFYAHYTGKEDLLRRGFERLRAELKQARSDPDAGSPLGFSLAFFDHAAGYGEIYRALVGNRGGGAVLSEIRRALTEVVKVELPRREDLVVPRELHVQFVVDSLLTILTWWLERKPELAPQEIDNMFRRLASGAVGPEA